MASKIFILIAISSVVNAFMEQRQWRLPQQPWFGPPLPPPPPLHGFGLPSLPQLPNSFPGHNWNFPQFPDNLHDLTADAIKNHKVKPGQTFSGIFVSAQSGSEPVVVVNDNGKVTETRGDIPDTGSKENTPFTSFQFSNTKSGDSHFAGVAMSSHSFVHDDNGVVTRGGTTNRVVNIDGNVEGETIIHHNDGTEEIIKH